MADHTEQKYRDKRSGISVGLHHPFGVDLALSLIEGDRALARLCNDLKQRGVKALHPDDGWVDRKRNKVHFCYPDFKLPICVGDSIALGDERAYRICVVTAIQEQGPFKIPGSDNRDYYFREVLQWTGM